MDEGGSAYTRPPDLGVSTVALFELKKIDSDYFEEESVSSGIWAVVSP